MKAAGISAIYFFKAWGNMDFWPQAAWLTKNWEQIDRVQQGLTRGTIVELKQNGKSTPIAI